MKLFLELLLYISFAFFYLFFMGFFFQFVHFRTGKNKIKPIKDETRTEKVSPVWKRLFWEFPRQFVYDKLTINPNRFAEYGLFLFCGEQGSGKSLSMVHYIKQLQYKYPKLIVRTNFGYADENAPLTDWHEMTLDTNGIYGELDCIDEIQNWFSSNASRNFPPDMLTLITQQRKVRRQIVATSQVFTRVAKPIRENTYLMAYPFTIFGCVTFVRVYRPYLDAEGNLKEKKLQKFYFFVHTKELREAYDSYKTIMTLSDSGFKEEKTGD